MRMESKFTRDGTSPASEFVANQSSRGGDNQDRSIGDLIKETKQLTVNQVEQIIIYQRERGVRFGEAAVALDFVSRDDVLRALAKQYSYPYAAQMGQGAAGNQLPVATNPFSDDAEAFRDLRSQLMMGILDKNEAPRALAITSPNVGDGKTYIASNLAVAFSQLGQRTLLIDADMRTPRLDKIFDLDLSSGLSNVLSGRTETDVVQQIIALPNLYVMPVGGVPPNPMELVQRPTFALLIKELLCKFDHVIIDTPASVHGADSRVIAARAGAAIVVGRRNATKMSLLNDLLARMQKGSIAVAGVVINDF